LPTGAAAAYAAEALIFDESKIKAFGISHTRVCPLKNLILSWKPG